MILYMTYTQAGTIAQFVSRKAKKVIGIESVSEAIEAAKENATNIDNCAFYVGDMKEDFTERFIGENGHLMLSQTHQEMECTKE